ncbi:MAG: transcriptional repressor LexA [Actinobacteria bacterium]|nr:MAG: transcriptional repressor LexA [Actinomycetota bacterium]
MKQNISKRQQQILNFINSFLSKKGYPPSVREIGKAIGLSSSSTVHSHLSTLEKKGFLRRDQAKPRALEVLGAKPAEQLANVTSLPLVGRIAAGAPILAEENIDSYMPLPSEFIRGNENFILTVKGSSMIEAGIFDGDYIVVRKQPSANNGNIVVALLEDEATVKTFYREDGHIRLQPENSSMEPIIVSNVVILGIVVAVLRRL